MFLQFYGLREQPFGVTPDTRFLFASRTYREAFASLIYGIESQRAFFALIAPPGAGKTTLLFQLLDRFRASACTVFLFQTQCSGRELFQYILADMEIDHAGMDMAAMHHAFNNALLSEWEKGRRCILVVDEAQNLEPSTLETVRLFSNFETPDRKFLQIVLAGQPQFADRLADPDMAQLRQRISMLARLQPLGQDEVAGYIQHRLQVAGYRGPSLFDAEALNLIARNSEGIPRIINNLCFGALSLGFALQTRKIDSSIVRECVADLDIEELRARKPRPSATNPAATSIANPVATHDDQTMPRNTIVDMPAEAARLPVTPTGGSSALAPQRITQRAIQNEPKPSKPRLMKTSAERLRVMVAPASKPKNIVSPAIQSLPYPRKVLPALIYMVIAILIAVPGWRIVKSMASVRPMAAAENRMAESQWNIPLLTLNTINTSPMPPPAPDVAMSVKPEELTSATIPNRTTIPDESEPFAPVTQREIITVAESPPRPMKSMREDESERPALPKYSDIAEDRRPALQKPLAEAIEAAADSISIRLVPQTVSKEVIEGNAIEQPSPIYPPMARAMRLQGEVVIQMVIGKNGAVESARVIRGHPLLAGAALEAVKRWRYTPYKLGNEPIAVDTTVRVKFTP